MNKEHLRDDDKFKSNVDRVANYKELDEIVSEWTADKKVDEVVQLLLNSGLPAGPILDMDQVYNDPHVQEREMFTTIHHPIVGDVEITNQGFKMSKTSPYVRGSSPLLGEHTLEVLKEFGFTSGEIDLFRENGII